MLFAAVAAAVPVLVADVHGSAIIILAILAAGSGVGIYILAYKKCFCRRIYVFSSRRCLSGMYLLRSKNAPNVMDHSVIIT